MTAEPAEIAQQKIASEAPGKGRRRTILIMLAVLLLAGGFVMLRWVWSPKLPPLWGVLPPQAEIYLYADLEALQQNPVVRWYLQGGSFLPGENRDDQENETRRFIAATGFHYQDHLHQVAAARKDGNWIGVARVTVDRRRFEDYLQSRAVTVSQLGTAPVYTFGHERPLKLALVSNRELLFSIGPGDDGLAQAMLLMAKPPESTSAFDTLSKQKQAGTRDKWQAVLSRPLWAIGDGVKLLGTNGASSGPALGGFMLGEDTLSGIDTLLFSIESGPLSLGIDGELLCRPGVDPKPLAQNVSLLASLMRPNAPENGGRDYRPAWDAITVSTDPSSVLIHWRPTAQMLSLLTAGGK